MAPPTMPAPRPPHRCEGSAWGIEPGNGEAIRRIFDGHVRNRAFLEAEEFAERVVESGQPIGVDVLHAHTMGRCHSSISIERGRLMFQGAKMDHPFNIGRSEIVSFSDTKIRRTPFPGFQVRYRTADGEEKKLEMFPIVYAKKMKTSPVASVYVGEPEDYEATGNLTRLFARLVERFVR